MLVRDLDAQDVITLLLAAVVLALAVTVWWLTRLPAPPADGPAAGDGEITQELPVMDEVWQAFHATAPRRRRWPSLDRRRR
ncbi:hypothetical protein ACGF7U_31275 [Micromonospora sp. NPDC047670]|uniref:hypothetical protein n=1 Tax=Micromonospora sp. NPDC047670 TaxID=3364252 RepID=UPI00372474C6